MIRLCSGILLFASPALVEAFTGTSSGGLLKSAAPTRWNECRRNSISLHSKSAEDDDNNENKNINSEWTSDFDDYIGESGTIGGDSGLIGSSDNANYASAMSRLESNAEKLDNKEDTVSGFDTESEKEDSLALSKMLKEETKKIQDASACRTRRFSLGGDFVLDTFIGSLGFDEVTDWSYYIQEEDDDDSRRGTRATTESRRVEVQPNPFDQESQPRRTRKRSGSVVRIFRGEMVGALGGLLSSQGVDRRVLIKEFTGELALALAERELETVAKLQSDLLDNAGVDSEDWVDASLERSVRPRQDHANVAKLMELLIGTNTAGGGFIPAQNRARGAPFLGILGEVNLAELEDDLTPNDFYRALGVQPPGADAVWLMYEYTAVSSSTVATLASVPPQIRRARTPPQRGIFGNLVEPPKLPPFAQRADYIVKGIMKKAIEAMANLHDAGLVHRSIGRSSFILSSTAMDKREAASPYATLQSMPASRLVVKLADFGFSGPYDESTSDQEFCDRARSFNLFFKKGERTIASTNFAMAEDWHALGLVFLGLLLTALAEIPSFKVQGMANSIVDASAVMPATDEDTIQRLLSDIFDKDVKGQFREYVENEDVWSPVVQLLDQDDGAGWRVLDTLLNAREVAAAKKDATQLFSIRGLLSNPFFNA